MSEVRRVVIDTSTLIGAVLRPTSTPRQALLVAAKGFELCVSLQTLHELQEVLYRPKFDRYAPLQTRLDFLALVTRWSRLCEVDAASEQMALGGCHRVQRCRLAGPCDMEEHSHHHASRLFGDGTAVVVWLPNYCFSQPPGDKN